MQTNLYKNDLPDNVQFDNILAIDTEAMGLDPARDRLCLLQIYDGTGDCHLVQFDGFKYNCPNLSKVLNDEKKIIRAVLDTFLIFKALDIIVNANNIPRPLYCANEFFASTIIIITGKIINVFEPIS